MKRIVILIVMLLITGCTALSPTKPVEKKKLTEEQFLQQAGALHDQKQWARAVSLLDQAVAEYPESERLAGLHDSVKRDWQLQKRSREDWILVHEVRALQQKLPYLESLVEIDPENYITRSRLLFWRKLLQSKVASLIACGSLHLHLDRTLAEQCATLADEIKATRQSAHLLSRIRQDEAAREKKSRTRQAAKNQRQQAERRAHLLKQASTYFSSDEYPESISHLNELLEMDPHDSEAKRLLQKVTAERDQEIERLLTYGDRLYREEQIEQAVSVWESADKLEPGRTDISVRIERAMKVLQKLQEIRQAE